MKKKGKGERKRRNKGKKKGENGSFVIIVVYSILS